MVSIGGGTVAVCAGAAGAISIGARAVVCAGAVVACTGAFRGVLALDGAAVATFFGGSVELASAVACRRDSTGALGIDGTLPASANVVAEVLPFVLVSATFASDFTGVALALEAVAGLFGDEVTRSSTNAPPITTAVIAPNAMPK